MAQLRENTWSLDEWYDQSVAGTTGGYTGEGNLYSWGAGSQGRLGLNDTVFRSSPTQVPGAWGAGVNLAFTVGYYGQYTMAVKTDGTLWGWGKNQYGALMNNENGNPASKSSPIQIPGTYVDVGTSNAGTAAIKSDGTMWVAGHDSNGNLGLGHNQGRSSPTQLPGTTWSNVTGGGSAFMAVKTDGTFWTWGENNKGQLGHNNKTQYSSPRQVPGSTWTGKISINTNKCGAIKSDGTLWTWGDNDQGVLGHNNAGEPQSYSSPKQIPGTTWNRISGHSQAVDNAGSNFLATKTDGTLWAWGAQGDFGCLGLNQGPGGPSAGSRSSPTQVGTDTNWSLTEDPFADSFGACHVKNDGTFWVWGGNDEGRLGFNTPSNTRYSSPTQLPGTWAQGFVTYGGSMAVKPG